MINSQQQVDRLSQAFPDITTGSSALLRDLMTHATIAQIPKGEYVCIEGTRCGHLALVLSGQARVFKTGESGREITLYRVGPGESCILTASCILSQKQFPAFAVCERPVEAAVIPAQQVLEWLEKHIDWRNYLFGLVASRLDRVIGVVEDVVFRRMDQRIGHYLLSAERDGNGIIKATHQQIADDLGTSREVVSRILKDLENRELILGNRGRLQVLDDAALKSAIGEA